MPASYRHIIEQVRERGMLAVLTMADLRLSLAAGAGSGDGTASLERRIGGSPGLRGFGFLAWTILGMVSPRSIPARMPLPQSFRTKPSRQISRTVRSAAACKTSWSASGAVKDRARR